MSHRKNKFKKKNLELELKSITPPYRATLDAQHKNHKLALSTWFLRKTNAPIYICTKLEFKTKHRGQKF